MYLGYLFGRYKPSERAIPIRADDIFVVSFCKSGNTWTRFLLANLLNPGRPVTFESIERTFPDIYRFQYQDYAKLTSPRVIKSHECFDPPYRRIIYIVRDPRDVAILLYHFLRKIKTIDDAFPLETYASDGFIRGKGSGRTWREHVGSWLLNPRIFSEVAGLSRGAENKFALLEQLEQKDRDKWFMTQHTRKDINFVRAAKAEQWRTALSRESTAKIEGAWGRIMQLLGYGLAMPSAEEPVRSRPPVPETAST
jgi:hypothetical protein